jgi:5-hydroxyisourate hydrolase
MSAVRAYYERMSTPCPFPGLVEPGFVIADAREHAHLPFKFPPWGLALLRGV